jgi:hypothetical protein
MVVGGEFLRREFEEPAKGEFLELARESGVADLGERRALTAGLETCIFRKR